MLEKLFKKYKNFVNRERACKQIEFEMKKKSYWVM